MKTLLENMKTLLEEDATLSKKIRYFGIGEDTLEQLLAYSRFPFVIIDRAEGVGEEYIPTDAKDLRKRLFHVTLKIAVRIRKKETALLGDDGLLAIYSDVMSAVFSDETVGGRVRRLSEEITVEEATISTESGTTLGLGRQINLTYMTEE